MVLAVIVRFGLQATAMTLSIALWPTAVAGQTSAALLRWPARSQLSLRFEVVDSNLAESLTGGLPPLRTAVTQLLAVSPSECPPAADTACTHVEVRIESIVGAVSMDSGRTYHQTGDLAPDETTIVALSLSGEWTPVANGPRAAAAQSVESLASVAVLTLPGDSVRPGDRWPVERTFSRSTASGLLQTFFVDQAHLDSITDGRE